jgi:hypothetical protein
LEDPSVEMRVSVEDASSASELVRRLAMLFDPSSISFDSWLNEVRVQSEWESRAVAGVVDVLKGWLQEDGAESATLSIRDNSHTLVRRFERESRVAPAERAI